MKSIAGAALSPKSSATVDRVVECIASGRILSSGMMVTLCRTLPCLSMAFAVLVVSTTKCFSFGPPATSNAVTTSFVVMRNSDPMMPFTDDLSNPL